MFKRRAKSSLPSRVVSVLWPTIGWRRSFIYIRHRLGRLPGTPFSIAAGFACGAAVSFTPLVGLHFFIGGIWAWLIRANVIASAIGTAVGNPWTFPFIWMWLHQLGNWMGAAGASTSPDKLDFGIFFSHMINGVLMGDIDYLMETIWPVWWPMMVGAIPSMLVVWFGSYLPLKSLIQSYHVARRQRMSGKSRKNKKG